MRWIGFIILIHSLLGCSSTQPKTTSALSEEEVKSHLVSVGTTLEHIFQSYALGCVEANQALGRKNVFLECRGKAQRHTTAVENLLRMPAEGETP
jgi:hypothetical protein